MFDKIEELEKTYMDLEEKVNDPDIIANQEKWQKLMKEYSALSPIIEEYRKYKKVEESINEAEEMLGDSHDDEFRQMIKEELSNSKEELVQIEKNLKILLLPKDPNDEKNVIMEIRSGAGGDEAALFAGTLFRMYSRYSERHRWKTEIISSNASDLGGFKEICFMISGEGAYSRLKFESGVHRVQRVPSTENGGRIHTSTVTVAVLPEAEKVDVNIDMNDVRIDVFRASGNGGQCVNTTDSAVRVTHIPTGIVVSCQDEKSQIKNKDKALKVLYSRLYEFERKKHDAAISENRRQQVGTGDRSEKIRTYNFPQGRVTDHRAGITLHKIDAIIDGDLDDIMDVLITQDRAQKLKESMEK
ncbi:MAG: peptide chain release factor 1 [Clostridia bacterium]|jgi:peptide chain release factor 1|nr:peptide chain release factor 1 [Clostridia bacterium]MCI1998908.1 peptide chain release factor 1 [Clostridia bacterium]MCI2013658.1 peptide chain release factor 1 [Clostridia bacterium]